MPRTQNDDDQHRRFIETAHELEADEDKERFEEKLKQIAKRKPREITLPHLPTNTTRYGGMTVNERLSAAGLMEQFDLAARGRDGKKMISLLQTVELSEDSAIGITDTILANPTKYGY